MLMGMLRRFSDRADFLREDAAEYGTEHKHEQEQEQEQEGKK
jgi:hypothetical protein